MKNVRVSLALVLALLTLLFGALAGAARAQSSLPTGYDPAARFAAEDLLPFRLPGTAGDASMAPIEARVPRAAPVDLGDWSRLAFQSYRDGNWEIYLARGDGLSPSRLTNHSASDVRPRLNRGATRVVFASNRGGNYDIYTVNTDGSGLRQLTNHGPSDNYPAWSADGSRIAFAYYKNENWEIYVMNADGSGQMRLTYGEGANISPAWSPDGRQIAWLRVSGNDGSVMVMNVDGSNQHAIAGPLKYAQNPTWSPDGKQLAFDYDADGDNWNELVVVRADGSGLHTVFDPGGALVDAWMGSWSPDGRYLLFTLVLYVVENNQLYYGATGPVILTLADGSAAALPGSGMDLGPDWQTMDILAPASGMEALPAQSPAPIPVRWSGADLGEAGLAAYDVQVRDGAGAWVDWLTGTTDTAALYPGIGGHTYAFRVRASDQAGNIEAWPADYDARTTVEALPPESMVNPLPALSTYSVEVRWGGSDAGGSGIKFYDVQVRDGLDGGWANWLAGTTETVHNFTGVGGHTYYFRVQAVDNAENREPWPADWDTFTTIEALPPNSVVAPLPAYMHNDQMVKWGGTDPGGSGIAVYQVQVRDMIGGNWFNWKAATGETSAIFNGVIGHTYIFRVRATDRAQNVEPWPADADTITTLYTWAVTGAVRGPRGVPLARASAATTPTALAATSSSQDGVYAAYVVEDADQYAVTWSRSGFGALPTTMLNGPSDVHFDVVMPPMDNMVQEWGFEGSGLGPGWQISGAFTPTITNTVVHTGAGAALLGSYQPPFGLVEQPTPSNTWPFQPMVAVATSGVVHLVWNADTSAYYAQRYGEGVWSSPFRLSNSPGGIGQIALDDTGAVHVVWGETGNLLNNSTLFYARRDSDGVWSVPLDLTTGPGSASDLQLAVDAGGVVHMAWCNSHSENFGLYYKQRGSDGVWSNQINLSQACYAPRLAAEADGTTHLIWMGSLDGGQSRVLLYARQDTDGTWSAPHPIAPFDAWTMYPQMKLDAQGTVHVAWMASNRSLIYIQRSATGAWSVAQSVFDSPVRMENTQLAVEPDGVVHLAWFNYGLAGQYNFGVFYARRGLDGVWSRATNVSMIPYWLTEPRLAVDGRGIAHVVWVGIVPGGNRVYYTRQADDGAWLSPRVISVSPDYAGQPVLVAEPGGNVHVAWRVWECILYAQAGDSPRTGDSTIAQTVSVPVETSDPTLSLFYQFGHTWSGDDSWFAVQVQDGVTATSLFSTTAATADWTHRWFDLSPWAGQAITLTFNVHQTAGGPTAWAYLDEVTAGSGSYPDLWIGAPTQLAQPGAPVTYTLAYGNRGDGLARDGQISLTLPAGLSFVSADPSPSALGPPLVWNLGDLPAGSGPATIVIAGMMAPTAAPGSLLISTVGITTSTLEVEPDNNQTQMYVFVDGRRRYLPLIRR